MHEQSNAGFPATQWSKLGTADTDQSILSDLIEQYWPPVYAFLRRSGYHRDAASEATQAFFVDIVMQRKLFGRADHSRGRFRSFLLTALRNFLIDQSRVSQRLKMAPQYSESIDQIALDAAEPSAALYPEAAFNQLWAQQIFQKAIQIVRTDCSTACMQAHWLAFDLRVLRPAMSTTLSIPIDDISKIIGVSDPKQVSHMIQTVKRKLSTAFHSLVEATIEDPSDLEDELNYIKQSLQSFNGFQLV